MSYYIKREDVIDAIEMTDWYHQNRNKDMVLGANSAEHQAWYKAQDVYAAINSVSAADVVERPRWIPVTERLPEEPYGCLLIVWDSPYDGGDDFLNYLPYFAGWDGEQWNDDEGIQVPFEVAYWMPLPEPPKEVDE